MNATTEGLAVTATTVLDAPIARGPFGSFNDLTHKHSGHFFDEAAMRGFGSKILDDYSLYLGRFFRTSEQDRLGSAWGDQRLYSLRLGMDNGDVETVGEFGEFGSAKAAAKYAENLERVELVRWGDVLSSGAVRTFYRVQVLSRTGKDVLHSLTVGSPYYDLAGALAMFDQLAGIDKRKPLHVAIAALASARHSLYGVDKLARQLAMIDRRHAALVAQLVRSAGVES